MDGADRITAMLEPGETLRWVGRPVQGVIFRLIDVLVTASAFTMILGLYLFWTFPDRANLRTQPHNMLLLFSVVFGLGIIDLLVVRYWWDARYRRRVIYGLSTERAFIATRRKVHAYSLEKRPLKVERHTARWLTLRFGENRIRHQWFGHMLTTTNPISRYLYAPRFDAIPVEPMASLLKLGEHQTEPSHPNR